MFGIAWKMIKSAGKTAIIIPFRNRFEHLQVFVRHMHPFLMRQNQYYQIFVIEQEDDHAFNRGKSMNVGFIESLKVDSFDCFIFHDDDLIPENDLNDYSWQFSSSHLSVAIDKLKYALPYTDLFGGVEVFRKSHFELVNGFSNDYWGWGAEDDDLYRRLEKSKLILHCPSIAHARYKALDHKKATKRKNLDAFLESKGKTVGIEGLNTPSYRMIQKVKTDLSIAIFNMEILMMTWKWLFVIEISIYCHGLLMANGSLIEDEVDESVPITKTATQFQREIFNLISKLPSRKYCWFTTLVTERTLYNRSDVSYYLEQFGMPMHNGDYIPFKSKCYEDSIFRGTSNMSRGDPQHVPHVAISAAAVHVYNSLPITFQCHILKSMVFQQGLHLRSSEYSNSDATKDIQIVEKSIQRRYSIKSVASSCSHPSMQGNEISRTVKLKGSIKEGSWSIWNKHFKRKLSKLLGKFSRVDPSFPQPSYQSLRSSPQSLYHLHLVKVHSKGPAAVDVDFHVHMKEANTKAIPAHTLISALDRFNKTALQRALHIQDGFNYTEVEYQSNDKNTITFASGTRKQRLKKLIPVYLGHYFSLLTTEAKCYIVDSAIKKGNTTMEAVLSFLSRRHIDRNLNCQGEMVFSTAKTITEKSKSIFKTFPLEVTPSNQDSGLKVNVMNYPVKQRPQTTDALITTKVTVIELILIVVVSTLLLSIFVFIGISIMYKRRKLRLQRLHHGNTLLSKSDGINDYETNEESINTPLSYHTSQSSIGNIHMHKSTTSESYQYLDSITSDVNTINTSINPQPTVISLHNNKLQHMHYTQNDNKQDNNELHTLV